MRILEKSLKVSCTLWLDILKVVCVYVCVFMHVYLENEVDGEGFLLLTDEDMGDMVKPLGARRKLITKRNMLTCVSTFVAIFKGYSLIIM